MKYIVIVLFLLSPWCSFAKNEEAIQKTVELLLNQSKRDQYIAQNKDAQKTQSSIDNLTTDPALQQKIFEMSSLIFQDITKKNSDPAYLMEVVAEAQKDPKKFYESLSTETKAKIEALSVDIEKSKNVRR